MKAFSTLFCTTLFLGASLFAGAEGNAIADLELAKKGDTAAQYRMYMAYSKGQGIEQNIQAGQDWLKKSADAGNPEACLALADLYREGILNADDDNPESGEKLAKKYYEAIAGPEYERACLYMASIYEFGRAGEAKNLEKAREWYFKAAATPDDKACLEGRAYLDGRYGFPMDHEKAFECFDRAVTNKNVKAHYWLGCMYSAPGKHHDKDKAVALWKKGAAAGDERCKTVLKSWK